MSSKEQKRSLASINKRIQETQDLFEKYVATDEYDDYSLPVQKASVVCEILVTELLEYQGVEVRDRRVFLEMENGSEEGKWVVAFLANNDASSLPKEYIDFFKIIYHFGKEIKDNKPISKDEMEEFMHIYECFLVWFFSAYEPKTLFSYKSEEFEEFKAIFDRMLTDIKGIDGSEALATIDAKSIFSPELALGGGSLVSGAAAMVMGPIGIIPLLTVSGLSLVRHTKEKNRIKEDILNKELEALHEVKDPSGHILSLSGAASTKAEFVKVGSDTNTLSENEEIQAVLRNITNEAVSRILGAIHDESKDIKEKLDDISLILESLMQQIKQYQTLVQNQIEIAVSDEEIDRIVHVYSETCVDRIVSEIDKKYSEKVRIEEEVKLISALGEAWDKLSDESKNYLVSAKVTYGYYSNVNSLDYSGVCLLVTKALELEMSRRFYSDYTAFLKQGYEDSWKNHLDEFPTTLIKEIDGHKKLKSVKDFTLGSVSFVLCFNADNKADDFHLQNNEKQLIRFVRNRLMDPSMTDQEIMEKLRFYGEAIDDITKRYRNKAAHTNQLKRVDADECFELVIDVEKLLKKILDSFLY